MKKEKISVIVPIYNVEKYLRKCIKSIINQTYQNLEIILVDDGATDNSGEICEEYAKKDNRIKVIHKVNGGLSDARNAGIEVATGDYIGFVDSDDYIAEDMYQYLLDLLLLNQADISICGYELVEENKIQNIKKIIADRKEIWDSKKAIIELLKQEKVHDYAWNKLYKKQLFDQVKYPYGRKMEDLGTTYQLFELSNYIVLGNQKKYFYLQREGSIVNQKNFELYRDKYELTVERYQFFKKRYPDMIENDIDMLDKILRLYQIKDKRLKEYIRNNEIESLYYQIRTDKPLLMKKINLKMKIKMFVFEIKKQWENSRYA